MISAMCVALSWRCYLALVTVEICMEFFARVRLGDDAYTFLSPPYFSVLCLLVLLPLR